ncbi:MAG TPA: cytochrome P450 [Ktedonobacterales bacterium]|nr:cytochrome P450 [Ktedonobacterales bacterium]
MQHVQDESAAREPGETSSQCPVDHVAWSRQKTAPVVEPVGLPVEHDAAGVWHVRGFGEARAVLRSGDTKQAGFGAPVFEKYSPEGKEIAGILYKEGPGHHEQRRKTARFFTPKAVSANYRSLMEQQADMLVADLQHEKQADLSQIALAMAVRVASLVVGLTNSSQSGMTRRLEAFFENTTLVESGDSHLPRFIENLRFVWGQRRMTLFFLLDVKPAIKARRRQLQDDVISHLISQGYNDTDILTECVTYAAAGMVTTREFISVATWHFLEQPELRERYLAAPEEERYEMLHEVLRLEPVVAHLLRRATADVSLESNGASVTIPKGALMDVHIRATNADESIVGEHPLELCPGRALKGDNIPSMLMSFGDGHHRCPGAYIAIQETDILLQRLLAIKGLHMEKAPTIRWNDITAGYELRGLLLAVD